MISQKKFFATIIGNAKQKKIKNRFCAVVSSLRSSPTTSPFGHKILIFSHLASFYFFIPLRPRLQSGEHSSRFISPNCLYTSYGSTKQAKEENESFVLVRLVRIIQNSAFSFSCSVELFTYLSVYFLRISSTDLL